MSVYTQITIEELHEFLSHYDVGTLIHYEGIQAGIENTNYFVDTSTDRFVLTIFESHSFAEMPYFLELMAFLHTKGVPSVWPIANKKQQLLQCFKDKPTTLVHRLPGQAVKHPTPQHCATIGDALGHLHLSGLDFNGYRDNDRDFRWWETKAHALLPHLMPDIAQLLTDEIAFHSQHRPDQLPHGIIHADLFRDNALFDGDTLGGVIDFYYACNGPLLYDLGVTINDWCSREDGTLDEDKMQALLHAYQQQRSLTTLEYENFPVMLRAAALRFWISRLYDQQFPRAGHLTHSKNPFTFQRILQQRILAFTHLQESFRVAS